MRQFDFSHSVPIGVASDGLTAVPTNEWSVLMVPEVEHVVGDVSAGGALDLHIMDDLRDSGFDRDIVVQEGWRVPDSRR